jgi:hypothetical protein
MLVHLTPATKTVAAPRTRPAADNDDDPFDPPPAQAARLPRVAAATIVVRGSPLEPLGRAA